MKYKFLFLFFITTTFHQLIGQNTVGTISLTNEAYNGYTLFTLSTESYLINNCGEVINQWSSTYPPGNSVYLLENGNLLRTGRTASTDIIFGGQGGIVEMYNWEGSLIWSFLYDTPQHRQHHDIFPLPNGNVLILAADVMTEAEALQAGRDPNLLLQNRLFNEQIIEVEPVGSSDGTIVWEWNFKDHLIQELDPLKNNYGSISDNPQLLDINFTNGRDGQENWIHVNSIQYNEKLDQILISGRSLSEIFIIDHSTTTLEAKGHIGGTYGKGGDFLYRWGNPQSYGQGTESNRQLYGQHYPHWIPEGFIDEGKVIVYNNGIGRMPLFSEVYILELPETIPGVYSYLPGTSYGPTNPDYIYKDPVNIENFYSGIVSSAQRLPNGNTLICEGQSGHSFEINPMNKIVWEYISPVNNNSGKIISQGDSPIGNTTFRTIKYAPEYPAFIGRDLSPGSPIELNSNLNTPCEVLNLEEFEFSKIKIYPNPTSSTFSIYVNVHIDKIEIYNLIGLKINSIIDVAKVDLSNYKSGVYIIKIYSGNSSIIKKIIKQ